MDKKELARLQALWTRKLKAKGFNDIEDSQGRLKAYHSSRFLHANSPTEFAAKQRYYELVGQLLHKHRFESLLDRRIWDLHSKGGTYEEIGLRVGRSFAGVRDVIKRIEKHLYCEKHCCTPRKR